MHSAFHIPQSIPLDYPHETTSPFPFSIHGSNKSENQKEPSPFPLFFIPISKKNALLSLSFSYTQQRGQHAVHDAVDGCTVHRAERGMCSIFEVAVVAMQQQRSNNTRDDGDETQDQIKPNHSSQQQNSGVAADQ